jgi:hypothetical protein
MPHVAKAGSWNVPKIEGLEIIEPPRLMAKSGIEEEKKVNF